MARQMVTAGQAAVEAWSVDTVVVPRAPDRLDLALMLAAGCTLLAPAVSLALGVSPAWLPGSNGLWRAAHLSAVEGLDVGAFTGALATQTLIFIAVILAWRAIAQFGPQSGWLLPELRADAQARDLFDATRPTVLIYVARTQRTVRILVSPTVSAKLPAPTIEQARQLLVEGIAAGDEARAIDRARALLGPSL